ncbi:MAG: SDR family oxidoreductase [Planctomycetia bacterium]|nr:SDR family oxidoreductase [Planctomycetia bacterium]
MDLQLRDKVALVTGGGQGVGEAICRQLHAEGARVAVLDADLARAERVASALGGIGVSANVADTHAVEAALKRIDDAFGALHVVVSNVGLTLPGALEEMTDPDIERTLAVNIRGALNVTRAAVPRLRAAKWGRLIYIGSGSGLKASAGLALYSASKYFLHGLCVAAGLELGRDGITANIICPSDIYPEGESPAGSWLDPKLVAVSCQKEGVSSLEELAARRIARTPAGRSCATRDVALLAAFLASPMADFINAQAIGVNGGSIPT